MLFISNYSSNSIIINYKFNTTDSIEQQNYMFEKNINDIRLVVKDELLNKNNFVISPMKTKYFLSYFPAVSIFEETDYYEKMASIPFLKKINEIYKSFVITNEMGNVLLSLDTIENYIIKRKLMGIVSYYYIEVFDDDLEGKPASEW